jgi:hypothetical protein
VKVVVNIYTLWENVECYRLKESVALQLTIVVYRVKGHLVYRAMHTTATDDFTLARKVQFRDWYFDIICISYTKYIRTSTLRR